jgi:hypothetical protein
MADQTLPNPTEGVPSMSERVDGGPGGGNGLMTVPALSRLSDAGSHSLSRSHSRSRSAP